MNLKDLGRLVTTSSVSELAKRDTAFKSFVAECLGRYMHNDWGDLSIEDRAQSDNAVRTGEERIFASYSFFGNAPWSAVNGFGKKEKAIWIITEWDHSVTTILFPSEY